VETHDRGEGEGTVGIRAASSEQLAIDFVCRSCGAINGVVALSLGHTHPSIGVPGFAIDPGTDISCDIALCYECSLLQLTANSPLEDLLRDYPALSDDPVSFRNARQLRDKLVQTRNLGLRSLVVDVAASDGCRLELYRERGCTVLGVEPALVLAELARQRGIDIVPGRFTVGTAVDMACRKLADVILATDVGMLTTDLNDFVEAIAVLLAPEGVVVIELPYIIAVMETVAVDAFCHDGSVLF
jgi:SAM-dependent methyltransferase